MNGYQGIAGGHRPPGVRQSPAKGPSTGEGLARTAPLFAALGDETRLSIVVQLCRDGPQSISRLADGKSVSRQAVTKHLHTLESVGLATSRREGRKRIWALESGRLEQAQAHLDRISTQWDAALGRLRALVEEEE